MLVVDAHKIANEFMKAVQSRRTETMNLSWCLYWQLGTTWTQHSQRLQPHFWRQEGFYMSELVRENVVRGGCGIESKMERLHAQNHTPSKDR